MKRSISTSIQTGPRIVQLLDFLLPRGRSEVEPWGDARWMTYFYKVALKFREIICSTPQLKTLPKPCLLLWLDLRMKSQAMQRFGFCPFFVPLVAIACTLLREIEGRPWLRFRWRNSSCSEQWPCLKRSLLHFHRVFQISIATIFYLARNNVDWNMECIKHLFTLDCLKCSQLLIQNIRIKMIWIRFRTFASQMFFKTCA